MEWKECGFLVFLVTWQPNISNLLTSLLTDTKRLQEQSWTNSWVSRPRYALPDEYVDQFYNFLYGSKQKEWGLKQEIYF